MPEMENYKRPPVGEALIDIRVERLPAEHLPLLENLYAKLGEQYPKKKVRHQFRGSVRFEGGTVTTEPMASGPLGYWFESEDGKRIVQVRLDGFTYNRIKPDPNEPWSGWESMRADAKEAWEHYAEALHVEQVTRIAVRYINRIVIPTSPIELYDYFTAPPRIPPDLPYQDMLDFSSSVAISIPEHQAIAVLKHAPAKDQYGGAITVTVDIDVYRPHRILVNQFPIWETLDQLRELKNKVFEASLLPRTKEIFK